MQVYVNSRLSAFQAVDASANLATCFNASVVSKQHKALVRFESRCKSGRKLGGAATADLGRRKGGLTPSGGMDVAPGLDFLSQRINNDLGVDDLH